MEAKDYYFVEREIFHEMIARAELLEWATVHHHYKGTSRDEVFPRLEQGIDVVLDIDVQGARQVRKMFADALMVFVLPPSAEELARRLVDQYTAGEPEILREDFYLALQAAYTPEEVSLQLIRAGLDRLKIETASERLPAERIRARTSAW